MENKKSLTTLLIILAIVLIGGGLYLYYLNYGLSLDFLPWFKKSETTTVSQIQQIEAAKRLTEQNVQAFVKSNSLDDLTNSDQYQDLQGGNVNINLDNSGNPQPFNPPPAPAPITRPGL